MNVFGCLIFFMCTFSTKLCREKWFYLPSSANVMLLWHQQSGCVFTPAPQGQDVATAWSRAAHGAAVIAEVWTTPVLSLSYKCRLWFPWFSEAVEQLDLTECVWSWFFWLCTVYRVKYCIQTSPFCCCFSVSTTDCRPNSLLSAVTLFASLLCSDFKFQNHSMYLSTFIIY